MKTKITNLVARLILIACLLTSIMLNAQSDLIGYWPFDGNGNDLSGNNLTLTLFGSPGFEPGRFGQAMALDGTGNKYAQRPGDDEILDFNSNDFTISIWVKYNSISGEQVLIEKFSGTSGPGWCVTKVLWCPQCLHFYSLPAFVLTSAPLDIATDVWHNVVACREGTNISVYFDGVLVAFQAVGYGQVMPNTIDPLLIGRRNNEDGRIFGVNGFLDDVAIWSRCLTLDEISLLWDGGNGTPANMLSNPLALYFSYEVDNTCSGDITLTPSGGTPPYLYSDDGGLTYQASNVFANEPAGNYNLIVMDANNNSSNQLTATVTLNNPLILSAITSPATDGCNGSVTLMPSGGSVPYNYAYLDYPFSGTSLDLSLFDIYNGNFSENGGSLRADNDVSLNNGWSNSIATSAVYPRTVGDSYEASFKFDADSYVCFGWTNGEALYDKNQIAHGFYTDTDTEGPCIKIKDANFYENVAKWIIPGTWYDFKIVLTSMGADYYCKESSSSLYNLIWTGSSAQFYPNMGVGATYCINGDNYNGFNTKDWVVNINYAYLYYFYGTSPDPNIFDIYNGNFSVYNETLRGDNDVSNWYGAFNSIATSEVHPRIVGNSFEASFKFDLGSYVYFGWTNGFYHLYVGLEHGFYIHNGTSIRIKEDIYYEDVAMWITPGVWYDFKIVLTSIGANYYCKESSSSVYNQIWTGTSASLSPNMNVGAAYEINGINFNGFNTKNWVVNINQPVTTGLCPGTYNYIVHDAAGCYTTASANIISCPMTVEAGTDATTYFGIASMQEVTRAAVVTGGTPPYTYEWTLDRPLLCNQVNSTGDESFYGGTCANNTCPESGSPAENASCSGSETITAILLDTAEVCVTVTDANGCTATDCFMVNASDVRCFSGNGGGNKVKMCHHSNSNGNPWVEICVDTNSIDAHLAHGDYIGVCDNKSSDPEAAAVTDLHFRLFPNPATNRVTIIFESSTEKSYIIELDDMTGRTLITYQGIAAMGENTREIQLAGIQRGIYLVKLILDGKKELEKIVVE